MNNCVHAYDRRCHKKMYISKYKRFLYASKSNAETFYVKTFLQTNNKINAVICVKISRTILKKSKDMYLITKLLYIVQLT